VGRCRGVEPACEEAGFRKEVVHSRIVRDGRVEVGDGERGDWDGGLVEGGPAAAFGTSSVSPDPEDPA
jgi:hypothetical protein